MTSARGSSPSPPRGELAWDDSDGNGGFHEPYIDVVTIPGYEVFEIQTVGVDN